MWPRLLVEQFLVDQIERVVQVRRYVTIELLQFNDAICLAIIEEGTHI